VREHAGDDRVLPATRALAAVVIPAVVVATVVLFGYPGDTGRLFAWQIKAHMSAFVLASAYGGGTYFFVRVLFARRWHRVAAGLPSIWAFVVVEAGATLLHWEKFEQGNIAFWLWAGLYLTTPFVIPLVWLRNRPADPGTLEADDVTLAPPARIVFAVMGAVQVGVALFLFLFPDTAMRHWGWTLTPLTARSTSGWFALGVLGFLLARDGRWSSAKVLVQSLFVSLAILGVGVVRAWDEFDTGRAATWLVVACLAAAAVFLLALYTTMERPRARAVGLP
jgi:hypothetical protein